MYCPKAINAEFEALLTSNDWAKMRVPFEYSHPMESFEEDFSGYDEADFVKNKIGIELQLGKYAFTAWDMLYRFLRFHHLGKIKVGIEILPSKILRSQMSSGVGDIGKAFRCLSVDPQVPLLIIGIAP